MTIKTRETSFPKFEQQKLRWVAWVEQPVEGFYMRKFHGDTEQQAIDAIKKYYKL